ncbi:anhydro-N-acetylmuramic acid kinase [Aquisalinus luteolus]|uniref:Anhydro-N-acetylmuramic acid kinase n=2 Tax=Aquisalinus luteolus TaxID=1566827 RepID=A0A8J3A385_9PROT|nr:anhydro-N-acetylmuramic acid kinase [Aquisalinus luteolus]GGH96525.1 anhydro-N-acetylmuramic acid kinase [Aquisalinus luteolus]
MSLTERIMTAIGLMSGTSLDGIDVAVLRTDGHKIHDWGPVLSYPYERDTKIWVRRAIKAALEGREGGEEIAKAVSEVTTSHIKAVQKLMEQNHLSRDEIDVIGFHGQTILHRPPLDSASKGRTWQIGSGDVMAKELRIDVVDQFRMADMAAGGEGAPLAPAYHAALAKSLEHDQPLCVLNLGGVSNLTFIPAGANPADMVAFDCGPGNGLVDQWVDLKTGEAMDTDGALAAAGTVDEDTVRLMALNPYLRRKPPKSLDRYDFKYDAVKEMSVEDGAATLTAFTAECIKRSVALLPAEPAEWIVVGGGRHNPVLMEMLAERLDAPVRPAEDVGWRGDHLEAECFAYLAVRSLKKLPLSWPKTTRVPHALTGGHHHHAPWK